MSEPEVGGAPEVENVFAGRGTFLAGATRKPAGPNPTPALIAAGVGAAAIAIAGVLLRHLKVSIEPGFTDNRQVIEMLIWVAGGVALAGAALWFGYAPRRGLKLKIGHLLAIAAGALIATALVAAWVGFPTAAQILDHKVAVIAAQARDDSTSDILLYQSQSRTEAWVARLDPANLAKEENLPALRKTVEGTADYINDFKTRLAERRKNINVLLNVAARTPAERIHAQDLYNRLTGDLVAQEDRYWDTQAQAMNLGCVLVDNIAYLRSWKEAKARGYPVRIDEEGFMRSYGGYWQKLLGFRDLLASTAKDINRPLSGGKGKV
jgi:hypothetical protein